MIRALGHEMYEKDSETVSARITSPAGLPSNQQHLVKQLELVRR